jgi:hypothetical protein
MRAKTSTEPALPEGAHGVVPGFLPWHLFLMCALMASAGAALAVRGTQPANVVFVCLTVLAAGLVADAVYRALWPLVRPDAIETPEVIGGRTRAALEREKTLVLRAIKELEFERAIGKVSESDWQEMTGKLRARAVRLIRQLDGGSAAYRELIEKELVARQAAGQNTGRGRGAVSMLLVAAVVLGSLLSAVPARGQVGGMGGAGMPDARAMSGMPRPDGSVPEGTVSVRLVRGRLSNPVAGGAVEFIVGRSRRTVSTDESGRAVVSGLAPGSLVRAVATVNGERVESQDFEVPAGQGVLLLLVAAGQSAAEALAKRAVPGEVTFGGQSRVVTQFEDEVLQVYYLLDVVNASAEPVSKAFVLDLPSDAMNAAILEGSAPNALANGRRVTFAGPFAPGVTSVQVAYTLPPAARVSLRQEWPVALDRVAVMAERIGPMALTSPELTAIREGNDSGRAFLIGTGPGLRPGGVLTLVITGLPHHATWPRNVALGLAMAVLAAGAWGASRTGGRSAEVAARQQLAGRREAALAELLQLDRQRQAGQVNNAAAAVRREEILAALERIYGELDVEATTARGDQVAPA